MSNGFYKWYFLVETIEIEDMRSYKDASKFIAATKNSVLYLRDIEDENTTYNLYFDIIVIVDTDKKQLSYPKHYIGSYQYSEIDEIYNSKNQYIKKIYNDLIKFGVVESDYSLKNLQSSYLTKIKTLSTKDDIVMYHGTTKKCIDSISRFGLRPIDTNELKTTINSKNRGNNSTIANHTEKNIYLTPNRTLAIQYAKSQAKYRNDIPVLCTVIIPDTSKLMLDDDVIIDLINNRVYTFLQTKSDSEIEFYQYIYGLNILNTVLNNENHILDVADDEDKIEFIEELIDFVKSEYKKLLNSDHIRSMISLHQAVAYKGRIPVKFITIEELPPLEEKISNFQRVLNILRESDRLVI